MQFRKNILIDEIWCLIDVETAQTRQYLFQEGSSWWGRTKLLIEKWNDILSGEDERQALTLISP